MPILRKKQVLVMLSLLIAALVATGTFKARGQTDTSAAPRVISSDPAAAGYGITTQCNGPCGTVNQIEVAAFGNSLSSLQSSALATFSTNANLVASGNHVFRNGFGLLQSQGVLYTLQNNTVELNGVDISGLPTARSVR